MNKNNLLAAGALALICLVNTAHAAVSVKEADKLKGELTPLGGERQGNGSDIPPWRGGLSLPPESYQKPGQHHPDPYPQDKPLFEITASNMSQFEKYLTAGQKAMFATYPDTFRMPVYKPRRTAAAPDWVYENTYKNAIRAELTEAGNGLLYAYGGIPFPIAKTGLEAIWNHITRWRGTYLVRRASEIAVHTDGDYSLVTVQQEVEFNYYRNDRTIDDLNNILFYYLSFTKAPARLAGGAVLVHETLNQVEEPRQAWGYNAGQRRVRRAPNLAYDTPIAAADGLRYADDTDMYNGAPDRYEWELKGKREIYIPYNSYRLTSGDVEYEDLIKPGHLNPDYTRYEKHRVWVVEGRLKDGVRHVYSKRVYYLDEDTWQIAAADLYDEKGELWRVNLAYIKNFYELPVTWSAMDVFHDIKARRYHLQGLDNEENGTVDYSQEPPGERYFTPSELRRRGRR
ncbi:MAG: outer membrane lipoprotein-sorting protein [Oceanospirillaceae bacterium]|nr:outer membrane lipoprotein-sorting protein [Oceanospirillaceae bacterium]